MPCYAFRQIPELAISRLGALALCIAFFINTGGCSGDKQTSQAAKTSASRSSKSASTNPGVPPEVASALHEWPLPGRDYSNSRYTRDSPIDRSNVNDLKEAWRVDLDGFVIAFGMCSTAPLIVNGTVYIEDLYSGVAAIDLATGKKKWAFSGSDLNPGPNGVAVGWGKVFAVSGSSYVVAYDAETGKQLWKQRVVDTNTDGIDIQPTVFDGQVLVSSVPISTFAIYTPGDRGILKALDEETGDELWRFDTVKSDDFWGNADVNSGGGAWYPPSIDIETGRVFWAVANPAPFPGTAQFRNGKSREGDNLFTDSVLVLDVRTGEYQWHYQTVEHDLFDRDLLHTMLTEVDGTPIVVATGKEGRVWAFRRDNGKTLWGPVPIGMHENDDLTELTQSTRVLPGGFGGVLTPPALADGVVYVAALNGGTTHSPDGTKAFASELGTMSGNLVAIDAKSGNIIWDVPVDGDPTGGATVINDLVVTATLNGDVIAYEREHGEEVWRWKAPGGINAWLSVSGDMLIVPIGSSYPATVVALKLGGSMKAAGEADSDKDKTADDSSKTFSAIHADIFAKKCSGSVCHSGASPDGSFSFKPSSKPSAVRASLIDKAATGSQCGDSGMALVVAGEPDASLLYKKLTKDPPCGSRMPPTPLAADEIEEIRAWIENGALDD